MIQHPGRTAFLISKPLQLMIALCVVQQNEWSTKPVFVILDAFNGAGEVAKKLLHEFNKFQSPIFFTSRKAALAFVKKEKLAHLFIDSDVGFKNFMSLAVQKLSNPKLLIYVYEEGLGTYRSDLYSGFKKNVLSFFGVGTFFGGCRFVSSIYLYCVQEYIDKFPSKKFKVTAIQKDISSLLIENRSSLKRVFGFDDVKLGKVKASSCSLYLSDWQIDEKFLLYFKSLNGDLFVKPHPNIRNINGLVGVQTIGGNIPAELVIANLMESYEYVYVFDHQSSVRRYISGKNLIFLLARSTKTMV